MWIWTCKTHDLTVHQPTVGSFLLAISSIGRYQQIILRISPSWLFQQQLFPSCTLFARFQSPIVFQSPPRWFSVCKSSTSNSFEQLVSTQAERQSTAHATKANALLLHSKPVCRFIIWLVLKASSFKLQCANQFMSIVPGCLFSVCPAHPHTAPSFTMCEWFQGNQYFSKPFR